MSGKLFLSTAAFYQFLTLDVFTNYHEDLVGMWGGAERGWGLVCGAGSPGRTASSP